jgi:hypothetical protein
MSLLSQALNILQAPSKYYLVHSSSQYLIPGSVSTDFTLDYLNASVFLIFNQVISFSLDALIQQISLWTQLVWID